MQTRGTFPELNSGRKQSRRNGKFSGSDKGIAGFKVSGRPRAQIKNASTFAGRRAASRTRYGS